MKNKFLFVILSLSFVFILTGCTGNKHTIKWVNYDGEVLEVDKNIKEGVVAEYNGAIPFRASDEKYTYSFLYFVDSNNNRISTDYEINKSETFTAHFSRKEINPPETVTYSWTTVGTLGGMIKLVVVLTNGAETSFYGSFKLRFSSKGDLNIYTWSLTNFEFISGSWYLRSGVSPVATYLSSQYITYYQKGVLD